MRHLHRANLIRLAVIPALAAGVSVSAQSQTEPADARSSTKPAATAVENSPSADYRGERASETIGQTVRNLEDEDIGKINDMIVDMNTGDVRYAIPEFDPGIFQAEKLFAVPTTELRLAADGDDVIYDMSEEQLELVLDIDKSKLQAMKSFPDSRYSNLSDRVWVADIDRYFVTVMPTAGTAAGALNAGHAENPAPTELFTRLDKDGDGSLEKADVENIAEVENAWSRFDEDGDGRISQQEFMNNYPTEAAATAGTAGAAGTSGATDAPDNATDATASPVGRTRVA